MKRKPYKRNPGDFEIRILSSGKVVVVAPDEALLEVAQTVDPDNCGLSPKNGDKTKCRNPKNRNQVSE